MIPIDELSRICFGSLIIMTGFCYLITKYEIVEKIRKYKIANITLTIFNVCLSITSIYVISQKVFVGLLFAYLSAVMWMIQYSKNHSVWLRPMSFTAGIFLCSLLALLWFDSLPFFDKIFLVLKNSWNPLQ